MYTNMANLQQTMLLQQRMFLQALCQQNTLTMKNGTNVTNADSTAGDAKHFIAPSLSQYRFVSGQQVCDVCILWIVFVLFFAIFPIIIVIIGLFGVSSLMTTTKSIFFEITQNYHYCHFFVIIISSISFSHLPMTPLGLHSHNPTTAKRRAHGMEGKTASGW